MNRKIDLSAATGNRRNRYLAEVADAAQILDSLSPWSELGPVERDRELVRLDDARVPYAVLAKWMGKDPYGVDAHPEVRLEIRRARERVALDGRGSSTRSRDALRAELGLPPAPEDEEPEPVAAGELEGPTMRLMWVVSDRESKPIMASRNMDHAIAALADAWRAQIAAEEVAP